MHLKVYVWMNLCWFGREIGGNSTHRHLHASVWMRPWSGQRPESRSSEFLYSFSFRELILYDSRLFFPILFFGLPCKWLKSFAIIIEARQLNGNFIENRRPESQKQNHDFCRRKFFFRSSLLRHRLNSRRHYNHFSYPLGTKIFMACQHNLYEISV